MTNINIQTTNGVTVVSVAGHAEYSFDHNDIVCAALSTITQSFLQTLKYYEQQGKCKIVSEKIQEDIGIALFSYMSRDEVTEPLLTMALMGYFMLQKAYPDNIYINVD